MKQFLNKSVQIFPGDTDKKCGKVVEVNEHGIVIDVTFSQDKKSYPLGLMYFSHSENLTLSIVK